MTEAEEFRISSDIKQANLELVQGRLDQAEMLLRDAKQFTLDLLSPASLRLRIDEFLASQQVEQAEGFTHFPELMESVQQMDAMLKAEGAQGEREAFEAWCAAEMGVFANDVIGAEGSDLWACWKAARAALAQPSPLYDPKRCLACGGDHGNSGLPCPNMRVTAQAQPSPAPELEAIAQEMKPLPTEFARVIEEHLQELLIKGEQAPELERPEVVAFRLLNQLGEVMTEWHDGKPPEKFADLCGNPVTDVQVQAAYAGPVIKALPDWPPCSKACMPAHGGHRDLQCNCEQATRAKAEVMQDLELPQPVGWLNRDATRGSGIWLSRHRVVTERQIDEGALTEPVMTVAQHERILRQALGAHDDQSE
ncbi:hypothetical protein [Pseudomonas sp.]|uniref:hypothetical protein n=1 Tax=Pseudomonas sp. TaxID=306 RepID=UPI0029082A65|nr:hypothetical protein [Pseudomonas sp.]MDU4249067.1 hypothetical protein [Pseudomonas sp.]